MKYLERYSRVREAYRPAAPIDRRSLFCGRGKEIAALLGIVSEVGSHGILYGERGVGKTSLANVLRDFISDRIGPSYVCRVQCNVALTFERIWRESAQQLVCSSRRELIGFAQDEREEMRDLSYSLPDPPTLPQVARMLSLLEPPTVIVLDEFDRVQSSDDKAKTAELLKALSDSGRGVTVLLVGVAHDVTQLIGRHPSVARCLRQVKMPTMSLSELEEIIDRGLKMLRMTMAQPVRKSIVEASAGFPHFTHLLAKHCATHALLADRLHISAADLNASVEDALCDAQEELRRAYEMATISTQPTTMFPHVLQACATVGLDEHATFQAKDLEGPLSPLLGRIVQLNSYAYHLGKLSSKERGRILERLGTDKRHRYRFSNPLMRPYIRLRAKHNSMAKGTQMELPFN